MSHDPLPHAKSLDAERGELETVLASPTFSRAPALSRLLAYICEQHLAGQGEYLKEYTIGTQALGRGDDFDPDNDSVVRVMATRLRKRLAAYYAEEGAGHQLRIQLPETGYSPRFVPNQTIRQLRAEPPAAAPPTPPPAGQRRVSRWLLVVAALVPLGALVAVAAYRHGSSTAPTPGARQPSVALPAQLDTGAEFLVSVGSGTEYRDANGRTWHADRYCTGGEVRRFPERRILRTVDPEPYRSAREGTFTCDIPATPGPHEVHLHFAEIVAGDKEWEMSGDGWRRFNVFLNGKVILDDFDIIRDAAGANIADQKILLDVEPASDGFLHFRFEAGQRVALINGIEVLPGKGHKMRPIRILAGGGAPHYAKDGHLWLQDQFYLGGNALRHTLEVLQAEDPGLCKSERWGHFSYAIPVAEGSYKLTLRFAERHFGTVDFSGEKNNGGVGSRLFDVFCNGETLLRNFDVFRQAGGGKREAVQVFRRLKGNAQGKLNLSFVPVKDYAMVSAIEVEPEEGRD